MKQYYQDVSQRLEIEDEAAQQQDGDDDEIQIVMMPRCKCAGFTVILHPYRFDGLTFAAQCSILSAL